MPTTAPTEAPTLTATLLPFPAGAEAAVFVVNADVDEDRTLKLVIGIEAEGNRDVVVVAPPSLLLLLLLPSLLLLLLLLPPSVTMLNPLAGSPQAIIGVPCAATSVCCRWLLSQYVISEPTGTVETHWDGNPGGAQTEVKEYPLYSSERRVSCSSTDQLEQRHTMDSSVSCAARSPRRYSTRS